MFVATLIAAPSGPGLPAGAVADVAGRLGVPARDATWLDDGFAADIGFENPVTADLRAEIAGLASAAGFDLVVQERAGRRKRFLIADMDSTMIDQECIDELAAEVGIKDRVAAITARAMNGEIAFEPALRERVALLAGLPEATIGKVIAERITLASGGGTLVATMRAHGAHTALVSGGFTVFTGPIAERLGFHEDRANRLLATGGKLTGAVAEPILGAAAKVEALRQIGGRLGIAPADVLAVGDGANDLPMLELAGSGVALHAKPSVAGRARHRIDHGDLTALLFLQGYRRDEFRS
ncbi:phosphoserine phosphatase SerB [Aurantimonas sp. HBX-1]|uniref:phosphoserine phosphatase SerB n=1 Tax=Aurantimonas sp. HBX-1 TaxID=2906072 RepID=UPI001F35F233|nr:phosphoserine phosphatase SerB [Aurantimonas sp. HBX-1]UIJ70510.1 phosphoserine phosphatase SerB [Aurantimonas sp. HBX-1]